VPKILILDIETMPAVVERWDLFPSYTPIEMVIKPTRILCFAAKWYDQKKVMFHAAWDDDDVDAYEAMCRTAWELLDEADFVVGWNSDRFDIQYLNAAFGRLGLGPPSPCRSLDLVKVVKKKFYKGEMSKKLDWYAQQWLGDRKVKHDGIEMWQAIRRGTEAEKTKYRALMRKYNIHDVKLTERLFDRFRPWTGENFALYDAESTGVPVCTKCGSEDLHKRGFFYTTAFKYQRYRCNDCGSWSKGARMVYTTKLRPV
jgi:hypothetical protein